MNILVKIILIQALIIAMLSGVIVYNALNDKYEVTISYDAEQQQYDNSQE